MRWSRPLCGRLAAVVRLLAALACCLVLGCGGGSKLYRVSGKVTFAGKPVPVGKIYFTHISCKLLDAGRCACKDYASRSDLVPDCVRLTPENVRTLNWLPPSCGYRLVAEGRDLYWWHPLVSGDPNTVHDAGVSVRGRVQGTENEIADADLEDHIVQWPALLSKRARLKKRP